MNKLFIYVTRFPVLFQRYYFLAFFSVFPVSKKVDLPLIYTQYLLLNSLKTADHSSSALDAAGEAYVAASASSCRQLNTPFWNSARAPDVLNYAKQNMRQLTPKKTTK